MRKIEQLERIDELLPGRGREELADAVEKEKERYEQLLELAEMRRDRPEIDPAPSLKLQFDRSHYQEGV